ncbi:hypothetical protein IQ277_35760 [Nostocales cyanobacterium LEGE 12452]|nr:hypothetical protein [Nostocales cyanobacterium LEGE 12452]
MRVKGIGVNLSPNPFQISFLWVEMLLIGLLPPLLVVAAPHCIRHPKKCMEIKLRSQMDANVQQILIICIV